MILLSQTIRDSLSQVYTATNSKRFSIAGFYPYLLLVNAPSGTFTFTLTINGEDVFTKEFTSADLKSSLNTTNDTLHTFFPIVPTNPVFIERGDFTCTISTSGYSPSSNSYIAWIQQFEDVQNETEYEAVSSDENPLAMRIKIYKEGIQ